MILREEVQNRFTKKINYNKNMTKAYALILGQCKEGLNNNLQAGKDWETHIKNHTIVIIKATK